MKILNEIYQRLSRNFGPQHWWPGDGVFEIMVGAILTQNTNWSNVEKAIKNLRTAGLMNPEKLHQLDVRKLAQLIKPAGYFNIKAKRLKNFIRWLMETHQGNLERMSQRNLSDLREELLGVSGIGPETADSILLYALNKPTFVVDVYTYRILLRHNLIPEESTYDEIKSLFEDNLPSDVKLFNEYHALLVRLGKEYCKKSNPLCDECLLKEVKI